MATFCATKMITKSSPRTWQSFDIKIVMASSVSVNHKLSKSTLSKFTAEPLVCDSWFLSQFNNIMTQFITNKTTGA